MNNPKLLICENGGHIYKIASAEFSKYHRLITGKDIETITEDDGHSPLIVLGTDADNEYTAKCYLDGTFKGFTLQYGSDGYCIRSAVIDGRDHLFIGGGRDRAVLYAVYSYFEKVCGCRWFWDGDRVPNSDSIKITDIDIHEQPRFEYRGLRYFAHRGLHRFQAEHWGFEDWKKEIDWIMKKKLNLFMLRIGNDDIFQKAFPETVAYPEFNTREDKTGYNDRTSAWPLEYRGKLRKMILDYAFERDLMHPEDCGTSTHWYTPTPKDFLEKEKPDLFVQTTATYSAEDMLVWDIRKKRNMDYYMKLTETHLKEYGREGLFHTIGFAERMYSDDRAENQRMKLFVYRKLISYLRKNHPFSKLLIASWDLWYKYTPEEISDLLCELDPNHAIIFDYTSDFPGEQNFTNWNLVGKFPYIFGIFQAYCNNSGPLGKYDVIEKRLKIANDDDKCQGMVFWPELSHGDTFMTEYFANNAWAPLEKDYESHVKQYCTDRYAQFAESLLPVCEKFVSFVPLINWENHQAEMFFKPLNVIKWIEEGDARTTGTEYATPDTMKALEPDAEYILSTLAELNTDDELVLRDIYDIARAVIGRYIHVGVHEAGLMVYRWKGGGEKPHGALKLMDKSIELARVLTEVLGQHNDYSLLHSYQKLFDEAPVNSCFERTLKENATCAYNRTYVYEHLKYLYIPEMEIVRTWIAHSIEKDSIQKSTDYYEKAKLNTKKYFDLPLKDTDREVGTRKDAFLKAAKLIKEFF